MLRQRNFMLFTKTAERYKDAVKLFKLSVRGRGYFRAAALLALGEIAVSALQPLAAGKIIDGALNGGNFRAFLLYSLAGAAVFGAGEAVSYFSTVIGGRMRAACGLRLQSLCLRRVYSDDISRLRGRDAGEKLLLVTGDCGDAAGFLVSAPRELAAVAGRAGVSLAIALWLDWQLAIAAVALFYFAGTLVRRAALSHEKAVAAADAAERRQFSVLDEGFSRLQVTAAFGAGRAELRRALKTGVSFFRAVQMAARQAALRHGGVSAVYKAAAALLGFLGLVKVWLGLASAGEIAAVMLYLVQLASAQGEFSGLRADAVSGLAACARLDDFIASAAPSAPPVVSGGDFAGFEKVSFSYGGPAVLENISFRVNSGEYCVLAGPSGCGKTTALYLLLGLLRPSAGRTVCAAPEDSGVCLQEAFLWNDTVRGNILRFAPSATDDDYALACACAGAAFEQFTGALGNPCLLSRGQQQRVALARALARRPRFLFLDEALSSLEPEAEAGIMKKIRSAYPDMTVVGVSHRISGMKNADRIIWLKSPREVVEGSPDKIISLPEFSAVYRA